MRSKINLHIHTVHSDGGKTVDEVVDGLREAGVECFAITDHDEIEGNTEAARLAERYGLRQVNGVELSCCFDGEIGFDASYVCHIVGLGFDYAKMRAAIDGAVENKRRKMLAEANALIVDGYGIEIERVMKNGAIRERTDIARELIRKGYAANVDEAFSKILNGDKYIAFAKNLPTIKEGVALIHTCGGLAVGAHPYGVRGAKREVPEEKIEELIAAWAAYGIDGIEVFYQQYGDKQIAFLEALAEKYKLLKSIGTDYHAAPVDLIKYPEYAAKQKREQLYFEVQGVTADESIEKAIFKRR